MRVRERRHSHLSSLRLIHARAAGPAHSAARVIAEGLVDFGRLRGQSDALIESGAVTLFFPHGIGHMVGLGIRDAGEVLRGRRGTRPGFPPVRVDLPLEPGHCFTVEPGIYFVPALLQDEERRRQHADAINWGRVDRMLDFGGIRIEHNVLVTDNGFEILTADTCSMETSSDKGLPIRHQVSGPFTGRSRQGGP
jgi:Xaa-Pro aminopeptidase